MWVINFHASTLKESLPTTIGTSYDGWLVMVLRFLVSAVFAYLYMGLSGKVCKITKFADLAAIYIHDGASRALM